MSDALLAFANIVRGLMHTPPTACPHCNGLGVLIRETPNGRLFEWPCVADCPGPIIPLIVNRRRP